MKMRLCSDWRLSRASASHGFTLLELLVVMVIIGLLAAYVGPRYFAQLGKSERSVAKAQIESLARALDAYRLDTGSYPSVSLGLNGLATRPEGQGRWNGPYLQKALPLDPWGRPYIYQVIGPENADFNVLSYGKDGTAGGTGDNADISFH